MPDMALDQTTVSAQGCVPHSGGLPNRQQQPGVEDDKSLQQLLSCPITKISPFSRNAQIADTMVAS